MAVNEREATCGTSCQDLGGIVPLGRRAKMVDMTHFHPGLPVWRTPVTALLPGAWGAPPFCASSEPYGLSPRGQPEWDGVAPGGAISSDGLRPSPGCCSQLAARSTYNARRRPLVIFGSLVGRSVGPPRPRVEVSFRGALFGVYYEGLNYRKYET